MARRCKDYMEALSRLNSFGFSRFFVFMLPDQENEKLPRTAESPLTARVVNGYSKMPQTDFFGGILN